MTIGNTVTRFGSLIFNNHYSGEKYFLPVFRLSGTSATWAFFSSKNEASDIYKTINYLDFESILTNYEPLSVFKFGSGMVCNETREDVQIYMFV
jgi:hypothetical protein